jgi:hypothetical protein
VAGIVVGALGVLDDVTVSQVSTVGALRRANPDLSTVQLYREAIRVGRDHVASTVNTLVLAYAGASLPLLLFFAQGNQPTGRLITGEVISVEIVRMLVGSIGLVLAVPITTGLAAVVLGPDDDIGHGHAHGHGHGHTPGRGQDHGPGAAERAPAPAGPYGPGPGTDPYGRPPAAPPPGPQRPPPGRQRGRRRDPWDDFTPNEWPW